MGVWQLSIVWNSLSISRAWDLRSTRKIPWTLWRKLERATANLCRCGVMDTKPQLRFLRPDNAGYKNKAFLREKTFPLLIFCIDWIWVAVAASQEEAIGTPQCFVQMELTWDLQSGIKRIEMCSSVKLKVVQHDMQHYVLGLVKSNN